MKPTPSSEWIEENQSRRDLLHNAAAQVHQTLSHSENSMLVAPLRDLESTKILAHLSAIKVEAEGLDNVYALGVITEHSFVTGVGRIVVQPDGRIGTALGDLPAEDHENVSEELYRIYEDQLPLIEKSNPTTQ